MKRQRTFQGSDAALSVIALEAEVEGDSAEEREEAVEVDFNIFQRKPVVGGRLSLVLV